MTGDISRLGAHPYHLKCLMFLRLLVQYATAQHSTAHRDAMQHTKGLTRQSFDNAGVFPRQNMVGASWRPYLEKL